MNAPSPPPLSACSVLVTGSSGFIGTNLMLALRERGYSAFGIDPVPPRCNDLDPYTSIVDSSDTSAIANAIERVQPKVVYHLGARTDLHGRGIDDYAQNTAGLETIVNAIRSNQSVERAFFASSRLVCRIGYKPTNEVDYCPTTAYGESKAKGEQIVRSAGLQIPWCIFRPTSIWGPWFDIPYKTFFLSVAKRRYIHPKNLKIFKSFGFVGNAVEQLIELMEIAPERFNGKTFNLCDYPPIEIGQWGDSIADTIGVGRPRRAPLGTLRLAAKAGDYIQNLGYKNPPLTSFRLNNLVTPMEMDSSFVQNTLSPLKYSLEEGILRTVQWLRESNQI